jgi:hypothetical protein
MTQGLYATVIANAPNSLNGLKRSESRASQQPFSATAASAPSGLGFKRVFSQTSVDKVAPVPLKRQYSAGGISASGISEVTSGEYSNPIAMRSNASAMSRLQRSRSIDVLSGNASDLGPRAPL